jgi:hypothetical protein
LVSDYGSVLFVSELKENVIIKISVPKDVADGYERQAQRSGKPMEELMAERLDHCKWHTSLNPLYFDDEKRHELEVVLSRTFRDSRDVIDYLSRTKEIRFLGGPIKIKMNDTLMKRLQTRKFGSSLERVVEREVLAGLERFCGLR